MVQTAQGLYMAPGPWANPSHHGRPQAAIIEIRPSRVSIDQTPPRDASSASENDSPPNRIRRAQAYAHLAYSPPVLHGEVTLSPAPLERGSIIDTYI